MSADRENNCLIDNVPFTEAPRIFNRKITSNAVQTLICEVIEPNDYFDAGSILYYDNDYWLCTSSYVFHDNMYCRGEFYRCNYKLRWQKDNGDIVERWVVTQDASSYSSGVSGNKVLNYLNMKTGNMKSAWSNQPASVLNRARLAVIDADKTYDGTGGIWNWYEDPENVKVANPGAVIPRATTGDPNDNDRLSDRYIEDGSYLRVKNITLGYTLPKDMLRKAKIESVRVQVNIQNLFTGKRSNYR